MNVCSRDHNVEMATICIHKHTPLAPALPWSVGLRSIRSLQTEMCLWLRVRLPFPIDVVQFLAPFDQDCPHSDQHTQIDPALQRSMGGAVGHKFFLALGLIGNRYAAKNDAIERLTRISALAALPLVASSLRMVGSMRSQTSSGTSQMVSNVSCLFMRLPPMLLKKP